MSLSALLRRAPTLTPRLVDGQVVEVEGAPLRLRVNARARRVSLRVDAGQREVVATAPNARRLADALAFAQSRAAWITAHLAALPPARPFAAGAMILLRGAPCRLERAAMRVSRLHPAAGEEPARLVVSGEGEAFARAVERALRREALADLTARTAAHSKALGVAAPPVSVADPRGRWGSCRKADPRRPGDRGAIRYNWRLVCAPPSVLDYVAAHEAAHLVRPDHSPAFWKVVEGVYGDCSAARAWLKAHGGELHALGR